MFLTGKEWNAEHRLLLARLRAAVAQGGETAGIVADLADLTLRSRHYLTRGLEAEAKRACSHFHYVWLREKLSAAALHSLLEGPVELWSGNPDGVCYVVGIRAEQFVAREGELSLELFANGKPLYALSFTVVPARLFEIEADAVFLVSRVQGRPDRFEDIRLATKAMSEVSPRAVLFAALSGVAGAVGIDLVLGVSAENFMNFQPDKLEALERQYDAFFAALEAEGPRGGVYLVDLGAGPKPVNSVKPGHRIRTRRKRQFKAEIAEAVGRAFAARLPPPQDATGR
jgi:uncharacterized protein VirK/YbjX